ncbi:hypothetical protein FQN57_007338 [Myotisia sp. PD_48]|nr:hypothetical protein FQN57_007338 [Myotisia sp. PD_48]
MRWFAFIVIILLLILLAYIGWIFFTRIRAQRAGFPPPPWKSYIPFTSSSTAYRDSSYPTPRSTGIIGWVKDKFSKVRSNRTHEGSFEGRYEPSGYRGASEHDEPWDARMAAAERGAGFGPPGYYEEQELGMAPRSNPFDNATHAIPPAGYEGERGRSRNREEQAHTGKQSTSRDAERENPFGDHAAEASMRDVSPRPAPDSNPDTNRQKTRDTSASGKRSAFRESL